MEESGEQPACRRLVARTGWAAKQSRRQEGNECYHCGRTLDGCAGCGELRCLHCEPYLSDDCRWAL